VPPHLQLTLLNVPPAPDNTQCLPRPQHVILSHLYMQRGQVRGPGHRTRQQAASRGPASPSAAPAVVVCQLHGRQQLCYCVARPRTP